MKQTIWTIGHSTRTADEFIAALQAHGIRLLADVRLLPGSKRYPHFNADMLSAALNNYGIRYEHFPELGGRRKPRPDSPNTAWRNDSFRGYADHMETPEFAAGIARLQELATTTGPAAIMCAEAVWWRCHRALVSDYLKVRGVEVLHIIDAKKAALHPYTSAARIVHGRLSYSAADETAR
ncbi:MAG: DUF488 domain-containing protein [Verrucomicrobiota bacterium]|nr:DUF488 domain-containing protein [Verrucomicrobiota bacterium]